MQNREGNFIINRIKSVKYAFKGAYLLVRHEPSIQVQVVIAVIMCALGFYFNISSTEWILQLITISLVISIEGVNTAIEKIADFIHPKFHPSIGLIKDIAAGAVFIASIFAVIIGLIIYLPRIF
jgi:diacylglycerol kinase (ATP)